MLATVGMVWLALTGEPADCEPLRVRILSEQATPFTCAGGVPIAPHAALADVDRVDVVIVAGLAVSPDDDPRGRWPAAEQWLRRQHQTGATICSVCTGAILLADAGLLDGLEATTRWSVMDLFRAYFLSVLLHPERIVLASGPEQRIVTSGGAASWEDLAFYLIARCRGEVRRLLIEEAKQLLEATGTATPELSALARSPGYFRLKHRPRLRVAQEPYTLWATYRRPHKICPSCTRSMFEASSRIPRPP